MATDFDDLALNLAMDMELTERDLWMGNIFTPGRYLWDKIREIVKDLNEEKLRQLMDEERMDSGYMPIILAQFARQQPSLHLTMSEFAPCCCFMRRIMVHVFYANGRKNPTTDDSLQEV